jgi:hypothetical protein
MKHTITVGKGKWLESFAVGLLCIPLGIVLSLVCLLLIFVGPVLGALGILVIEDTK